MLEKQNNKDFIETCEKALHTNNGIFFTVGKYIYDFIALDVLWSSTVNISSMDNLHTWGN